jgi:hypothetical protein
MSIQLPGDHDWSPATGPGRGPRNVERRVGAKGREKQERPAQVSLWVIEGERDVRQRRARRGREVYY